MTESCTHLFVHIVWGTSGRLPLISTAIERDLYACICATSVELRCQVLAIGGTSDHMHLVIRLHSTTSIAILLKAIKGASSHLVNHKLMPGSGFRWQAGYGAFSVSKNHLPKVIRYVRNQKEHHARNVLWAAWEDSG